MRAVQYRSYGSPRELAIAQLPTPSPSAGEVLVRVSHAALNPKDYLLRAGQFRLLSGRQFPKQSGLDFAGEVVASRSPSYRPGERVFGFLDEWRGARGTLAEVVCASQRELAHLPDDVSSEQGAAVALVGSTCLQALRDIGQIGPSSEVLVHGASGGVGTAAIQIARLLGARVTTVSSAGNRDLCLRLGAAEARSYEELGLGRDLAPFDCVFDVYGSLSGRRLRGSLKPGATFISTVPTLGRLVRNLVTRKSSVQERVVMVRARSADLAQLARWLKSGELRAVVDARYPLDDVQRAFEQLEGRHARGKVIVEIH